MLAVAEYFGDTAIDTIDHKAIDDAAMALHPNVTPASRNRYFYTPVSAILHHAKVDLKLQRPKGSKGQTRTDFINPDDAAAILREADKIDSEFGLLLRFLLYSGCRLGEALALEWQHISNGCAYVATSKNDDPRTVRLRDDFAPLLARRKPDGRVFRFRQGGHLKDLLKRATRAACGLDGPPR